MGLDMYAYAVCPEDCETISDLGYTCKDDCKERQFHYWRKSYGLHSWMQNLYRRKGGLEEFNLQKVRLTESDLDELERYLSSSNLPNTTFLFGENSLDDETIADHKLFIAEARDEIKEGKAVYYDSWW